MSLDTGTRSLLILLLTAGIARADPPRYDDYAVDERGDRFRVAFDPGTQLRLGLITGVDEIDDHWQAISGFDIGGALRSLLEVQDEQQVVCWQVEHRFLWGSVRPWENGVGGSPPLELLAYAGSFLRHTAAPYMVLPTSPPKRLFFPFDIGVEVELGNVRVPAAADGAGTIRVGVVRASVLLDPWRPGRPGNSLEIGVGVRYDLDQAIAPAWNEPGIVHRVAPFTDTSVRLRLQDGPGLTTLDLRAHLVPHWASQNGWQLMSLHMARFDRVLFAVNDQPVSLLVQADYRYRPDSLAPSKPHDFRAVLGLSVGFQLR